MYICTGIHRGSSATYIQVRGTQRCTSRTSTYLYLCMYTYILYIPVYIYGYIYMHRTPYKSTSTTSYHKSLLDRTRYIDVHVRCTRTRTSYEYMVNHSSTQYNNTCCVYSAVVELRTYYIVQTHRRATMYDDVLELHTSSIISSLVLVLAATMYYIVQGTMYKSKGT